MTATGRPRIVTDAAITEAGIALTLPRVTVRAVAEALGVSEMSIYRRTGGRNGLRAIVAEGIVERAAFTVPDCAHVEDAAVVYALQLCDFVRAHPGIEHHLANLDPEANITLQRIDRSQSDFADRYGISAAQASVLLSTVTEHAIAITALALRAHHTERDPRDLDDATPTIRAGAAYASGLSPQDRLEWSLRAVTRGALSLLGIPVKTAGQSCSIDNV